uniref:Uncharacterized protein n=1 Tax=Anopheles atroparvus TaxID=41427 RepID=A0A182J0S8_ANOAO
MGRKQCRICLEPDNDDLISVQLVQDQVTISDMIFAVAGISVTSDRRLPQNICLVCLERLKVAHDLRQQCIEADANLRAALPNNIFDHLEEHHSQWKSVSENDQQLEDPDHDEEEMLDELETVMTDAPRFTAVEGMKIEIQSDCKEEEGHESKHFSHESVASEAEETGEEEYVIEVDFDGESVMEENEIDNSVEEEHIEDYKQAPSTEEHEEHKGTTTKGQRINMDKLMCRIPSNVVRVLTEEECYSIVELVQERCCCCTAFFKTPEKLEKHLAKKREAMDTTAETSSNTSLKYTCEYCGMQFKYSVLYVVHKRVREQRQFYMCRLCRRLVDSEARMKSHMLHTEEHALFFKLLREDITDRYESLTLPGERCCNCWQYFDSHTEMLQHVRKTHALEAGESSEQKSNLPYTCEICKRRFRRQQSLERHLEQVKNGLQHFCKLCDFQTRSQKRMELHLYSAIHRSEMPSVPLLPLEPHAKLEPLRHCCFVNCNLNFRDVKALYQHVHEAHERKLQLNKKYAQSMTGVSEKGYLECDACGQQFKGITALKIHQSQSVQQNCVCSICGVKKRSRGALLEHERTHTGERPYGCDLCDKKFSSSTTLNSHMKCHTPRKYECGTCKEMFARLENLKRHIRLRHGEASYQCELCPKKFKTRENLTAHTRTHTGEKPYKCRTESCDKRYVNIGDRRRHEMAVHTLERPHKCSYCHMAFVRPRQLVIHERRHTGDKPFVCTLCGRGFYEKAHLTKHPCKAAA